MEKNKIRYRLFLLYFLIFYGLGVFTPYINVWLEKVHNLNGIQIGQISSISLLIGVLFAPIFGIISDKTNRAKQVLITMFILMIIVLQIYQKQYTYMGIIIFATIFELFKSGSLPIADTLASNVGNKHGISFDSIRTVGSFGYMIASVLAGLLIDKIGYDGTIFTSFTVSILLAILCLKSLPSEKKRNRKIKTNYNIFEIIKNKNFYIILIYIVFTTTIIDSSSTFMGNYLTVTLDAPKYFISIFSFAMMLPELVLLPFSMKIINKVGHKRFYLISAIIIFFRLLITGLTNNPYIVALMPMFNVTHTMVSAIAIIYFFRENFKPTQIATVLTLFATGANIMRSLYNIVFGTVYYHLGGHAIYLLGASLSIIAIITIAKTDIFKEKPLH